MSNFAIQFTVSLDTSRCDPEALDDLREQVQDAMLRLCERTFPSGDFGPNQSLAEFSNVRVTGNCVNKIQ